MYGTDNIMLSKPNSERGNIALFFSQVHEILKGNIWEEQEDQWEEGVKSGGGHDEGHNYTQQLEWTNEHLKELTC